MPCTLAQPWPKAMAPAATVAPFSRTLAKSEPVARDSERTRCTPSTGSKPSPRNSAAQSGSGVASTSASLASAATRSRMRRAEPVCTQVGLSAM
ncbi:hypothetical protein D3C72_1770910 [compost metagenome]